jgi:predicted RNA-binding protein associated with RNAse of E/G family
MTADSSTRVTPGRVSLLDVADAHAPKVEVFDVGARTNTDNKGRVREVDEYRLEPFGLYMARPMKGRQDRFYLESWLLPEFGLRITEWWWREGLREDLDRYVDIVEIDTGEPGPAPVWRVTDLYLDIRVRTGRDLEVVDTDELLAALHEGLVGYDETHTALGRVYRAVDGIARHGYDVDRWLVACGIALQWRASH